MLSPAAFGLLSAKTCPSAIATLKDTMAARFFFAKYTVVE